MGHHVDVFRMDKPGFVVSQDTMVQSLADVIKNGGYDNIVCGYCHGQRSELLQQVFGKFNVHMWQYQGDGHLALQSLMAIVYADSCAAGSLPRVRTNRVGRPAAAMDVHGMG